MTDGEIVEWTGALLVECLTGQALTQRFPNEEAVLLWLRARRPDIPPAVAELTAQAASSRGNPGASLATFAEDLRAALGIARRRRSAGRVWVLAAGIGTLALLGAALLYSEGGWWREAPRGSNGLSAEETTALDIELESVDQLASIDEHSGATQALREVEQLWFRRVALDDPRLDWNRARQAWVRHLAGDQLTAEQLLEPLVPSLDAALGRHHPYTRAVRLELAGIVEARGALDTAAGLRADAARATAELLQSPPLTWEPSWGVPWAPHVVAHVAPQLPEHEGFRRAPDGGSFVMPLTSTQRRLAGRDGWRLHLRAQAACRVSVVAGADPRGVTVVAQRTAGGGWDARVEGVAPALSLHADGGETMSLTVTAGADGAVRAGLGTGPPRAARIDQRAPPPVPPYALVFSGTHGAAGCAVVWWEIVPR